MTQIVLLENCKTTYDNNCFITEYTFDAKHINENNLSSYKDILQLNLYNKNVKIIIKIKGKVKKMSKFKHDLKQYLNSIFWDNLCYKSSFEKIRHIEYCNCFRPDNVLEFTDYLVLEKQGNDIPIIEKKTNEEYLSMIDTIKSKLHLYDPQFNIYDPQYEELIDYIQSNFLIFNSSRLLLFIKIITEDNE